MSLVTHHGFAMIENGNVIHMRRQQAEHELAQHFKGMDQSSHDTAWRIVSRALGAAFVFACLAAVWAASGAPGLDALGLSK